MNNKYIKQVFLPILGQSMVAILVVYFVSAYYEWRLDWLITFYLILLIYYIQRVYKFKFQRVQDLVIIIISVCSTFIIIPIYWIILKNTQRLEGILFQLLSVGLYVIVFSFIFLIPYSLGSDNLREQLEKWKNKKNH